MGWIVLICAAALAACSPSPQQTGQDEPNVSVEPISGAPHVFDPVSKTAEAFTGVLTMTELQRIGPNATAHYKLAAELGHEWAIEYVAMVSSKDMVGDGPWTTFLQIPEKWPVTILSVNQETLKPGTPNGGFCAPDKTGFIALAEQGDNLQVAAFKGDSWPPPTGKPAPLCGTFNYILRK